MTDRLLYTYETAAEALSVSTKQIQRWSTPKFCEENGLPLLRREYLNGRVVFEHDALKDWAAAALKRGRS